MFLSTGIKYSDVLNNTLYWLTLNPLEEGSMNERIY